MPACLLFCRQSSTRRRIRAPLLLVALAVFGGLVSTAGASARAPHNGLIAFSRWQPGGSNEDVYVVNADGSDERRLTEQPFHDSGPAWSPDGQQIAFFSRLGNNTDIYAMNADG